MKNKILSITVEQRIDESPDTSFLGEYTNKPSFWAIDRKYNTFVCKIEQRERIIEQLEDRIYDLEDLDNKKMARIDKRKVKIEQSFPSDCFLDRNQYRYFIPCNHLPHNPKNWIHVQGKELEKVIKEHGSIKSADMHYAIEDYKRMESLNRGNWCFIGIMAKATVQTENGVTQHITSGGLWGIESDSGDYIKEVVKEQLSSLKCELLSFGFSERAIHYAMKKWDGEIIEK